MSVIQLNIKNPKQYTKQYNFLTMDRRCKGIHYSHFVGGRGCAKTTTGVLAAWLAATAWNPGIPGLVTEPTYRHLYDVFLREWEKIVPRQMYRLNGKLERLEIINGSIIDLRSRAVDNPRKEVAKGPNYGWVVCDEAAYKWRSQQFQDIAASIRHPDCPIRFFITLTTPKVNDYAKFVKSEGHVLVQASSYDNPFLPEGFAEQLEGQMSPEYARQEIFGDFISQSGRIWRDWSDEKWPRGNILQHRHDPSRPYELWVDLGIVSSWLAVQKISTPGLPLLCVTHEWQPNNEGAAQTIQRIQRDMGRPPARVIVGADASTRSVASAERPIYYFRSAWGDAIQIQTVTGDLADKGLQHMMASSAILNSGGQRRLVAASDLISHDPENGRGFVEMMRTDQWGDAPRIGEYMPKTKGRSDLPNTEDTRDAMLYGVIVNCPPSMSKAMYQVAV